jgi:hypothetical protein
MSSIINNDTVEKMIRQIIQKDMNEALEEATDKVLQDMKNKIKEK